MANLKCTVVWLVFLLAHLDVELVQSLPSFSINISKCPASYSNECPPEPVNRCRNDQDCEARYPGQRLKCCSDCGKSCVSPIVTVVKMTPKRLKPRTRLVAKCPTSPPSSESPPGPEQECQNDGVCDSKFPGQRLKCCSDGCEFRCIPPVVEFLPPTPSTTFTVKGVCPLFPEASECPPEPDDECKNDLHCSQLHPPVLGLKCCKDGCELRCVTPIEARAPNTIFSVPGTCPVFPDAVGCPPEPDDECKNDQECSSFHPGLGLKCCKDGCDRRCVTPIAPPTENSPISRPPPITPISLKDTCPLNNEAAECPPEPDNECKNDQECASLHPGVGLKCCKDGCDLTCLPPL